MNELLLGIRLGLKGSRARVVITAAALAFAVAFLLAVLGALPARQAKLDRLAARGAQHAATTAQVPEQGLLVEEFGTTWRGRPVVARRVAAVGRAPLPPGLDALPRPGDIVVSPELRAVLQGPHGEELSNRIPGRVAGVIGKAGLAGPHELYAYIGDTPAALRDRTEIVRGFGGPVRKADVPRELRLAAWLGGLALLLPVLVLVGTATRLSAAARDRRLAAVRLVGASSRQAARLVAGEAVVIGVLGAALGGLVFLALRGAAASLLPFPDGLYAEDLAPALPLALLVLLGVPVLSTATALVALRRVVLSPLEVRRQARARGAGWVRLAPLAVGLAMLVAMRVRAGHSHSLSASLLLGGAALTVLGLAVATPAVGRLAGAVLSRSPGASATLAGRRVSLDPGASARVVTGTVLVVFVGSWLLAFLPLLHRYNGSEASALRHYLPGASLTAQGSMQEAVAAAGTVRAGDAVAIGILQLGRLGVTLDENTRPEDYPDAVALASCPDAARLLRTDLGCRAGVDLYRITTVPGESGVVRPGARVATDDGVRVTLPRRAVTMSPAVSALFPALTNGAGWLLDPSLVPAAATAHAGAGLVVRVSGGVDGAERVRAALPFHLAANAQTLDEQLAEENRTYLGYVRAVRIGVALALVAGACALLVATADWVRERRTGLAALVAIGTPLRVLRRSVVLQMAAPVLLDVLLGLAAAAVASAAYLGADAASGAPPGWTLPWRAWAVTGLGAVLVVLLATALTLPMVTATARPEALRAE